MIEALVVGILITIGSLLLIFLYEVWR